jgi:hypothetical protein
MARTVVIASAIVLSVIAAVLSYRRGRTFHETLIDVVVAVSATMTAVAFLSHEFAVLFPHA